MGNIFDLVLVNPILNLLLLCYHGLVFLHIPYALGFSIILSTVVIRLILYPLTASQLKATKKMQDLAPHFSRIKEIHKNDRTRQQQETMKLYKEHGINPAAGCLPLLVQLPLFWALYTVFQRVVSQKPAEVISHINSITYAPFLNLTSPWDTTFFGLSLGKNPADLFSTMPLILLVPLITGVLQYLQTKMMMPVQNTPAKKEKSQADDFAKAFQTQSLYIFPIMIAYVSFTFPLGLSLYWNTFTVFGILQQYLMQKKGE